MVPKLIAWKADDEEVGVCGMEFLPEGFERLELGGKAAFGGGVYDEDDLVLESGEVVGLGFL